MSGLFKLPIDLTLVLGLIIAAIGIVVLTRIGLLPKKSVPYALLAVGGAFGFAWFKQRQARGLRKRLQEEEQRLKGMEARLAEAGVRLWTADAQLEATRAEVEARRLAIAESIVELDAGHQRRIEEIAGLSGEPLDDEMTALLARLEAGG